jgi:uncharacterized membrane protein
MNARYAPTSKWKNSTDATFHPALRRRFDLHFRGIGVIHVVTAKLNRQRRIEMTKLIPEEAAAAATPTTKKPKANKKARVAPHRADVAPAKTKSARKGAPVKKAPKGRTKPEVAQPKAARYGSKTAKILDLLKRPGGATSRELMKATGWLPHSVRGFISGTARKKMGLNVVSAKGEDGERTYSVEA